MKIMRKKGKKLRLIIILIMITDNRSISNATLTLEWVSPYKELLPGVPAGIYRHSDTTIMVMMMMTIMTMMVTMINDDDYVHDSDDNDEASPPYKELLPAVAPRCPGHLGEPQSSIVILRYSSGTT